MIVAAEARVDASAVDTVRDALRTMEVETRKEAGCLTYAFSVDVNDPTMLRIFERWESNEALAAHFKTAHMAAFGAGLGDAHPKSVSVTAYEAEEVPLPR